MSEELKPDLCVIGAGAGGLAVAAAAATLGVPVVLIEKGKMGGDRLNAGAVPAQALLAAARRAEIVRGSGPFGVRAQRTNVEFYEVNDHVQGAIAALAPNDSRERMAALGVQVLEGEARFKDAKTVAVGDAFEVKARRFVIATGSRPAIPSIPGLEQTPFLTNETVFEARVRPKHLIVIGASAVGLELAQAFRRLGSDVTVLAAEQPLAAEDPEAAAIVLGALAREGVAIRPGVNIARVRRVRQKIEVVLAGEGGLGGGEETIEGTDLLLAAGRQPNVENLGLDAAGIRHDPSGIAIDRKLRTSIKSIYAIGDVTGAPPFVHVAQHHAGLVIRHALFRQPVTLDNDIPRVIATDPELAYVGVAEAQIRKKRNIRILRWPYRDNDRAQVERATEGFIKAIVDKKGKILGVTIVGGAAGEQIAAWVLAIQQGLNIRVFAEIVMPYPTFTEIGRRAAMGFFMPRLTTSRVRRILGWLRR